MAILVDWSELGKVEVRIKQAHDAFRAMCANHLRHSREWAYEYFHERTASVLYACAFIVIGSQSDCHNFARLRVNVASLKGLGPKSAAALRTLGIESIADLRARDPFDIYAELKANVSGTSLNFLYALIGAIEDVHWQEIKRTRRMEILLRLEEMGIAPK